MDGAGEHRLRDRARIVAAERHGREPAGELGLHAGRRHGVAGRAGAAAVGHLHAGRHRELHDGDRGRADHRGEPAAPPATPVKIGNLIAGTFNDATGHSGQSHLVYAPNAGVWWLFTLSSAHDALGDRTVQSYVSSGPDLATATWTAKAVSPTLGNVNGATSSVLAGGRSLGVAVRSIGGTDYAHVFVSSAFDGQTSSNGHIRAQLGATSITWGAWNNPGSPNTASEWQGPLNSAIRRAQSATSHVVGQFDRHLDRRLHPSLQRHDGSGSRLRRRPVDQRGHRRVVDERIRHQRQSDRHDGTSPPWTTAVIDKTMANECKVLAFAPLART